MKYLHLAAVMLLCLGLSIAQAEEEVRSGESSPAKITVPGAYNVTRLNAAVTCAGATEPESFAQLKQLGFTSIINLRRDEERGVDIAAARAAAAAAGLKYVHVPVDTGNITREAVDAFIKAVTEPSNQPMYIHCGSANRVAALWLIKRVRVDGWDLARATAEAEAIGLTNPVLRKFALGAAGE